MKNGLLRIAAQCWIIHETLNSPERQSARMSEIKNVA